MASFPYWINATVFQNKILRQTKIGNLSSDTIFGWQITVFLNDKCLQSITKWRETALLLQIFGVHFRSPVIIQLRDSRWTFAHFESVKHDCLPFYHPRKWSLNHGWKWTSVSFDHFIRNVVFGSGFERWSSFRHQSTACRIKKLETKGQMRIIPRKTGSCLLSVGRICTWPIRIVIIACTRYR